MTRRLIAFALTIVGVFVLALAAPWPAVADIVVNVDQAAVQPLPIAIPSFGGSPVGDEIAQVINADLDRSGLFRTLSASTFPGGRLDVGATPTTFDPWKSISAQALLVGQVSSGGDGRLVVDFRLWDVYAGEQLIGTRLTATPDSWRTVAHQIADAVYQKLTGEPGYFDTRIVFVSETGPKGKRVYRLEIMDQDGASPSYLNIGAADGDMVFAPRFSAKRQEITYMILRSTGTTIYLMNLETGRYEVLGRFSGMTMAMAPRFSPDDGKVAYAAMKDGFSDIYVMDLSSHATRRLTSDLAIDTSPSFSPDSRQIVFNSDRGGSRQIYVMNADGSNAHRVSFGSGEYTAPVWSPDGSLIAFVKQEGATFQVGVMNPDGSGERSLTTSYFADEPTWAPNGRMIMFERKIADGESRLWMVDVTGHVQKEVPHGGSASDPAWSPSLH